MKPNGSETCIPESIPEYVETNAVVKEVHPFHYNVSKLKNKKCVSYLCQVVKCYKFTT